MFKKIFLILIIIFPQFVQAATLGQVLAGKILLNTEGKGEAWYVNPRDFKRYYLGRPTDAFRIMREQAVGVSNSNLARITTKTNNFSRTGNVAGVSEEVSSSSPTSILSSKTINTSTLLTATTATSTIIDYNFAKRMSGSILLQVEGVGEAWYVNPTDLNKYYLGRPDDAFRIMRELSLGISREDLARVHKPGMSESIDQYSKYERIIVTTAKGNFRADVVEINLTNPNLKIFTDTADVYNCKTNCQAKSLAKYAVTNNAFAAINATYFCDSSGCEKNYYFYPVYNTNLNKLINEDQLKYWTTGPIMAFDTNNKFYYFKDSREFKSVSNFESICGVKLQAAIGNRPRLIENKMNLLLEWDIDTKQKNVKSSRNAIGYKDNKIHLIVAYNATVVDLADIMQVMEMDYALNLDGGYSSALYYNDEYMIGPGRDIPNAIIFGKKN